MVAKAVSSIILKSEPEMQAGIKPESKLYGKDVFFREIQIMSLFGMFFQRSGSVGGH